MSDLDGIVSSLSDTEVGGLLAQGRCDALGEPPGWRSEHAGYGWRLPYATPSAPTGHPRQAWPCVLTRAPIFPEADASLPRLLQPDVAIVWPIVGNGDSLVAGATLRVVGSYVLIPIGMANSKGVRTGLLRCRSGVMLLCARSFLWWYRIAVSASACYIDAARR